MVISQPLPVLTQIFYLWQHQLWEIKNTWVGCLAQPDTLIPQSSLSGSGVWQIGMIMSLSAPSVMHLDSGPIM